MGLHLNPLTSGQLVDGENGPALRLRAFAPGRSYRLWKVAQQANPGLFAQLHDWLASGRGFHPALLAPDARAAAALTGIVVTDEEFAALPAGSRPELGAGNAGAAALCPEIGAVLARPPALPELDAAQAAHLAEHDYAELPALLDAGALNAVRRYYRRLADEGWLQFDRGQAGRRVIHGEPVGTWLMAALAPHIAALAGEALKPSYAFAATYGPGNDLPRHTDRAMCEYTLSLFIEHRPGAGDAACPWPLVIHRPNGDLALHQQPGGGPLFRGRALEHSRPPLGEGEYSQMLFLHYVAESYAGSLD